MLLDYAVLTSVILLLVGALGGELRDQAEYDDAREPDEPQDDRDAVEVAFRNTRCAQVGCHAAAEHVRQPASAALVQEDEEGQQEARKAKHNLQHDLKNLHGIPFGWGQAPQINTRGHRQV